MKNASRQFAIMTNCLSGGRMLAYFTFGDYIEFGVIEWSQVTVEVGSPQAPGSNPFLLGIAPCLNRFVFLARPLMYTEIGYSHT